MIHSSVIIFFTFPRCYSVDMISSGFSLSLKSSRSSCKCFQHSCFTYIRFARSNIQDYQNIAGCYSILRAKFNTKSLINFFAPILVINITREIKKCLIL